MEYNSPELMFTHMQSHASKVGDVLRGSTGSSVLKGQFTAFVPGDHPIFLQYTCYYLALIYDHLLAIMPDPSESRFASSTHTAEDLLKEQTVGLVHYSDFRKRRAEALEQSGGSGASTPTGNESRYVFRA
jgi:hypothetical protein